MSKKPTLRRSISPFMLLLAAITLHLLFTIGSYAEGRLALFQLFDQGGFSRTIILDNADYVPEVHALVETLRENGVRAWLLAPGHQHLKP